MTNIIKNVSSLQIPCEHVESLEEAEKIANELFATLVHHKNGIGLAANQIGVSKAVCVVKVNRPLWFMNPVFTYHNTSEKTISHEGCLSFPDYSIITERYKRIIVHADNFSTQDGMIFDERNTLECVCVQHEICHLMGETMFDYQ